MASTSSSEERTKAARAQQQLGLPLPSPAEQDPLPCPRCDSTNTKFCYYNNYNFSQPRHFCKSCRRYWTQGGTLRDIPIGGGTRKSAKRSRTSNSGPSVITISHQLPTMTTTHTSSTAPVFVSLGSGSGSGPANGGASFTSLLSSAGPMGGFGFGLGLGLEEVGFGIGRGVWATLPSDHHHQAGYGSGGGNGGGSGRDTWQVESGGGGERSEYGGVGGDCFASLPELAISTTGNGLK